MKKIILGVLLLTSLLLSAAEQPKPAIYIEPQEGFETYLTAAIAKKGVPADVVTEKTKATHILTASTVQVKKETTGGKVARCLFL